MKKVWWIFFSIIGLLAISYAAVEVMAARHKTKLVTALASGDTTIQSPSKRNIYLHSASRADSITAFAKQLLGTKYQYGSCTPGGFDCSGFVYYVFSSFGISLPRSSITMGKEGMDIPLEEARKGDLIFFTGTRAGDRDIGHVGIVISDKGEPLEFIHSSSSAKDGGVKITPLTTSPRYIQRYVGVKRVF